MSFIPLNITEEQIADIQEQGLKWTVSHAYNNSPYYKKKARKCRLPARRY